MLAPPLIIHLNRLSLNSKKIFFTISPPVPADHVKSESLFGQTTDFKQNLEKNTSLTLRLPIWQCCTSLTFPFANVIVGGVMATMLVGTSVPRCQDRGVDRGHRTQGGTTRRDFKCFTEKCGRGKQQSACSISGGPSVDGSKNWTEFEVCSLWWRVGCKPMCATDPRTSLVSAPVVYLYILYIGH